MTRNRIDLSIYKEEFKEAIYDSIFLLSKEESAKVWESFFDLDSRSFFQLKNTNWLISSKPRILFNWLDDFNLNITKNITENLSKYVKWNNNDRIYFCISKYLVIESSWLEFKDNWISFMECDDDCPIIVNKSKEKAGLVFYPLGDLVYINESNT